MSLDNAEDVVRTDHLEKLETIKLNIDEEETLLATNNQVESPPKVKRYPNIRDPPKTPEHK